MAAERPRSGCPSRPRAATVALAVAACLLIAAAAGRPANGVRVLAFCGVAAKSHWNFMNGVLRALADAGHPVTVYTPFPDSDAAARPNYTTVDTSPEYGDMVAVVMNASVVVPMFSNPSILVPFMANSSRFLCDLADRLLADRTGDAFDVFVTEPLSCECVSHAARRLGLPLVYTVPAPLLPWIEAGALGHAANPAYVSHVLSPYAAVADTFYRRLANTALHLYTAYEHYAFMYRAAKDDGRYYDRVPPVKPALVFVNTHYVTEPSRPVPANRVDVGGVHLAPPDPLPAVSRPNPGSRVWRTGAIGQCRSPTRNFVSRITVTGISRRDCPSVRFVDILSSGEARLLVGFII